MGLGRCGMRDVAEDQPCAGSGARCQGQEEVEGGPGGNVSLNCGSTARALMAGGAEWRQGEGSSRQPCRDLGVVRMVAVNQNDQGLSSGISDPWMHVELNKHPRGFQRDLGAFPAWRCPIEM